MFSGKRNAKLKRALSLWFLGALLALATVQARAQGEASISGTVSDKTGSAIVGATVTVKNAETGAVRAAQTDVAGHYNVALLPVGNYEATTEKEGFQKEQRKGITLVLGQSADISFTLEVGNLEQTLQVTEQAEDATVTTSDTSGLVNEQQVKDLPLNGRSYDQLVTLNPGVVNYTSQRAGGIGTSNSVVGNIFSASGHRPQENLYILNGVEYTSASEINSTPGGVSGQLLGVDAVREFSVVSDSYGAEYGKRPGAQINIVTASGTNAIHGSVYEFLRNSALDARNFFDHGKIPPFERNMFGGSLGAPIKKDKSFIFVNYEGFRQKLGLSDLTLVPTSGTNGQSNSWASAVPSIKALQPLWPTANGPELLNSNGTKSGIAEAFSNPIQHIREDFGTARFDQTFSDKDSLAAVYTGDDSEGHSPTGNPFTIVDIFEREQVASLNETHVFSTNLINRATVGYSRGAFYFNSGIDPAVAALLPANAQGWVHAGQPVGALVVGGGTTLNGASQLTNGGTNAGSNLSAVRNINTANDTVTLTHGKHLFSVGVSFQRTQANDTLVQNQYGQASFSSLANFLAGSVSTYSYAPTLTPLGWRTFEGAFFVEDTIKVRPSLELSVGFRGEFTDGWNEVHGRASNYEFTNGVINTAPTIGNSALSVNNATFLPAPRVGLAWSPFPSKKTIIRASGGIYYGLIDNLSYRLDQDPPFNTVYAVKAVTATGAGHTLNFSNISPTSNYTSLGFNNSVIPSGVQPDLQTPTVVSYTLKIEQQLFSGTTLSVGYIGSHGYHELLSVDQNLPTGTTPYPTQVITATSTGLANPAVWNTTNWTSNGISNYNALQVDFTHHISHGLQFRGVYTYAKSLDDGDSLNTSVATNSPAFASNPSNLKADYGRASFDIRHSAVINATYDLPFGRGSKGWERRAIADWQISAIETLQTGIPFTPQLSYNPSNDGDTRNPVRPSLNPAFTGAIVTGGANQYFNPNAFIPPAAGTYGNAGRNILQGPSLATLDLSLLKKFALTERLNVQFRGEFFNILNKVNLNTPNPVVFTAATGGPSPTAGVITNTATTSRQIQFGLKLLW